MPRYRLIASSFYPVRRERLQSCKGVQNGPWTRFSTWESFHRRLYQPNSLSALPSANDAHRRTVYYRIARKLTSGDQNAVCSAGGRREPIVPLQSECCASDVGTINDLGKKSKRCLPTLRSSTCRKTERPLATETRGGQAAAGACCSGHSSLVHHSVRNSVKQLINFVK